MSYAPRVGIVGWASGRKSCSIINRRIMPSISTPPEKTIKQTNKKLNTFIIIHAIITGKKLNIDCIEKIKFICTIIIDLRSEKDKL